jgi:hypothetical protein
MNDTTRPLELLHSHHLSRQIGNVHERVKKLEAFHQDTNTQLKKMDSFIKANNLSDAHKVIEETKEYLAEAATQRHVLKNNLKDLNNTVLNVQDQHRFLRDDVHKFFSKELSRPISRSSDASLLKRVTAMEQAQKATDKKIDRIYQMRERFERGNEAMTTLAAEMTHIVRSQHIQVPQTPHNAPEQVLLPTSSTDSVIRSSPPLEHIVPSDTTKLFLQSGKKVLAVNQRPRKAPFRHSRIFWQGHHSSVTTPSGMIQRGKRRTVPKRDNLLQTDAVKSTTSASGFNIVGEPHQVTHEKQKVRQEYAKDR